MKNYGKGKKKRISKTLDKKSGFANHISQCTGVSIFKINVGDQLKTVMKFTEISIRSGQSL